MSQLCCPVYSTTVLCQSTGTHCMLHVAVVLPSIQHNCTVPINRHTLHVTCRSCVAQYTAQLYCANQQAHTACYMSQLCCPIYSTTVLCQSTGTHCMLHVPVVLPNIQHNCTVPINRHTLHVTCPSCVAQYTAQLYCAIQQAHTVCYMSQLCCPIYSTTVLCRSAGTHCMLHVPVVLPNIQHNCTVPINRHTLHVTCPSIQHNCTVPINRHTLHVTRPSCVAQYIAQLYCADQQAHTACYLSQYRAQLYCANQQAHSMSQHNY
jgi:hypothetical protein